MTDSPMPNIFVARKLPEAGLRPLADRARVVVSALDRELTPRELVEQTQDCRVLICTPANLVDAGFLDQRPRIRLVANYGAGVDRIDLAAAKARDVVVTNTPGVLSDTTANMAMAIILALTRRLIEGDRLLRSGGFKGVHPQFMLGTDLDGKVLGIYGMGSIGLALARRARAFGLKIIYHNRSKRTDLAPEIGADWVSFDELLEKADILSVNAPLTRHTRAVFNYAVFARMKAGAFFINTARGPIHDESALVRALDEGLIAGAGLDVYEREPEVHPGLINMPNVVLAPHLGTATLEVRLGMARLVAENVMAFLEGRQPPNRVV